MIGKLLCLLQQNKVQLFIQKPLFPILVFRLWLNLTDPSDLANVEKISTNSQTFPQQIFFY